MINTPLATVLQRYYGRLATYGAAHWKNVAAGKYNVPSSGEAIAAHERYVRWHAEHGYRPMTFNAILAEVGRLAKLKAPAT